MRPTGPPRARSLRGRRAARAERQGAAGPAVAGGERRRRTRRRGAGRDARAAVRRPRRRAVSLKDLFHATARDGKSRLVTVSGSPGSARRGSLWELEKYLDGVVDLVCWHGGRCRPMARASATGRSPRWCGRAGIAEDDDRRPRARSCRETLAEFVPDPRRSALDRAAAHRLLGLDELPSATATTSSPPGEPSSSGSPSNATVVLSSRTCNGPTRACSSSSSTCWSGRARTDLRPRAGPARAARAPPELGRRVAARTLVTSTRSTPMAMDGS